MRTNIGLLLTENHSMLPKEDEKYSHILRTGAPFTIGFEDLILEPQEPSSTLRGRLLQKYGYDLVQHYFRTKQEAMHRP